MSNRSDAARWRCRGMLDATSQELKLTMAKLEETRCIPCILLLSCR